MNTNNNKVGGASCPTIPRGAFASSQLPPALAGGFSFQKNTGFSQNLYRKLP
jgi:hypothetical protein